jgi:hypothetical protein
MMIKPMRVNLFYAFLFSGYLYGCPTCVGRITHDSPPFFSEEFYNAHIQKNAFAQNVRAEQHVMAEVQEGGSYE